MPKIVMFLLVFVALVFAGQGVYMHVRVTQEEATFHQMQNDYFSLSKAEREAAPTDSSLNKQLVQIQNYPSELLRLKLVGIGKILTGIFFLLFGILMALMMMPKRLAAVMGKK